MPRSSQWTGGWSPRRVAGQRSPTQTQDKQILISAYDRESTLSDWSRFPGCLMSGDLPVRLQVSPSPGFPAHFH